MPLTDKQKRIAICPYRYPPKEVYDVMMILGNPDEPPAFGDHTLLILMQLRAAAQGHCLPIPENFKRLMEKWDRKTNEFPNITPARRADYSLPPNS